VQRNKNSRGTKMQKIIKSFFYIINSVTDNISNRTGQNDVMRYFEAEYKKDPKGAYEHWRSTNKTNYSY